MYLFTNSHTYTCISKYQCVHTIHTFFCVCMHCVHINSFTFMFTRDEPYIDTYIHKYIHIMIHEYIYLHTYIYSYIRPDTTHVFTSGIYYNVYDMIYMCYGTHDIHDMHHICPVSNGIHDMHHIHHSHHICPVSNDMQNIT